MAAGAAFAISACSSSSGPEGETPDATTEGSTLDGSKDGAIKPEGSTDGGGGDCSIVKGACDIVLQDCPDKKECVVDSTNKTVCRAVQASQQLGIGRACCPGTGSNPCAPGLSCIGNECSDGGPQTGRCSPACCAGNDVACGKSDPEGISGACDLTIVDPGGGLDAALYNVCTYAKQCKPFKIEPCDPNEICTVDDKVGTASCVLSNGKTNRQPCAAKNDCADGLICLADGICRFACLLPNTTSPFDASVSQGAAGRGGCPAGEACNVGVKGLPDWFGVCSLPDGG